MYIYYLFLVAVALPFLVQCMNSSQIACTTQRCSRIPTVHFGHRIAQLQTNTNVQPNGDEIPQRSTPATASIAIEHGQHVIEQHFTHDATTRIFETDERGTVTPAVGSDKPRSRSPMRELHFINSSTTTVNDTPLDFHSQVGVGLKKRCADKSIPFGNSSADFRRTKRMSFLEPKFKERLEMAINAGKQLQKYKATLLILNGQESEPITDFKQLAKLTNIKYSTLMNHLTPGRIKKNSFGTGPRCVLGAAVEKLIVDHIIWMDEQGWPLSWRKISIIARDIAKREQISCDACRQWRKYFKRRHPELTTRVAENLERTRVGAMNKEQTVKYFALLEQVKKLCATLNGEDSLPPDRIFNIDEVGVDQVSGMDGDRQVVVLRIKKTSTYRKASADRTHLSAAVCIGADGWLAKTMYALKGKVKKEKTLPFCPEGTDYIMTKKGYFDDDGFFEYIKFLVEQFPKDGKWRLLVFDGYGAHTMVKSTLDYLVENKVHAVCMPSHTSQFLQPLDVSCFGPVKHEFRVSLSDLQFQIGVEAINKWELPSVFEFALQRGCSPQNVVAGFIKCGIYGISTEHWLQKHNEIFKISAGLDENRVTGHVSERKAAEIGKEVVSLIHSTLNEDTVPSPLKRSLAKLERLVNPCVEMAKKYAGALASPPKESKKRRSNGPAVNTLGEFQASAKWVTDEKRRMEMEGLCAGIAIRREEMEAAQTEKERQKEINQLAHNTKNAQEEVVRNILTVHEALQPEQPLLKQVLVDFYVSNREDIDHIIGSSIPVAKRTKGNLIDMFFTHAQELIEM